MGTTCTYIQNSRKDHQSHWKGWGVTEVMRDVLRTAGFGRHYLQRRLTFVSLNSMRLFILEADDRLYPRISAIYLKIYDIRS